MLPVDCLNAAACANCLAFIVFDRKKIKKSVGTLEIS